MKNKTKMMSTLGLIMITIWSAMQYIFLRNVPEDTPTFSFLCVTNLVGFVILALAQLKDFLEIRKSTVLKGLVMAFELTGFNFFLLLGSRGMDSVVASSMLSMYFIFIVPFLLILKKEVSFRSGVAAVVACVALLLTFNADVDTLFSSVNVIYLIVADLFFAAYVVTVSILGKNEKTGPLTICQMGCAALLSLFFWFVEIRISGAQMGISMDPKFWISVLFIGVLIRALYSRIQIGCQKNVPTVTASLIFSSEIVITLILEPLMCWIFKTEYVPATIYQISGCVLFVAAVLVADDEFMKLFHYDDMENTVGVDENGNEVQYTPVSRKVVNMNLLIGLTSLILSALICLVAIFSVRDMVVKESGALGQQSSAVSEAALTNQLENELRTQAGDKATLANEKLQGYAKNVRIAADYARELLSDPTHYGAKPVYYPNPENAGVYTMQTVYQTPTIVPAEVAQELNALGNLESVFAPMVKQNPNISTCYIGTADGVFISYDCNSGDVAGLTETFYYDYTGSEWYAGAAGSESRDEVYFTDAYQDSYGHGLTITCYTPVYDKNGNFRAAICMDVLMSDLNEEMVSNGLVEPMSAVLLDTNGGIIASKDIDPKSQDRLSIFAENQNTPLKAVANEILKKASGVTTSGEGEDVTYVAYSTVQLTGWKLCVLSPVANVIAPAVEIRENIDSNTEEMTETVGNQIREIVSMFMVLFAGVILAVTYFVGTIANRLTRPLKLLTKDVNAISDGKLDQRAKVVSHDEIGKLAMAFNTMTASLQHYISDLTEETAKRERLNSELSLANNVQLGMLPNRVPAFPDRDEFELWVTIHPAKEVGGDFYDYFFIDESHLGLVIADVSGKGVPAALFMVIAKTMIKNRALLGGTPSEILSFVNNQLCENNTAEMFVTVWLGILDLKTGKVTATNAGHEFPAVRRKGGEFELFKDRHGFVVAGMENSRYTDYELDLGEGDTLFVYTDGVAEANNEKAELFGTDAMLAALNAEEGASCEKTIQNVIEGIDKFANGAPQFDDITMLCITLDHFME